MAMSRAGALSRAVRRAKPVTKAIQMASTTPRVLGWGGGMWGGYSISLQR